MIDAPDKCRAHVINEKKKRLMVHTPKMNRRTFLLGLGASGLVTACGGGSGSSSGSGSSAAPAPNPATPTPSAPNPSNTARIPLTIDATQTDLPAGTAVYAYIVGEVNANGVITQYRIDASGTPHAMSTADNTNAALTFPGSSTLAAADAAVIATNYPLAWADYSIPVSLTSKTVIDLANINATALPGLGTGTAAFSGRIYLSVGAPRLPFTPLSGSQYTAPVPNAFPGMLTLFDWIEFSYDASGNFNGNTTQVDQFGFPLLLDGAPGGVLQGQFKLSRPAVLNAVAALGTAFDQSVPITAPSAYPAGIAALRVLSPKTITSQNGYSGPLLSYFNNTITSWYSNWQTTPLVTTDQSTGSYTGIVTGGALTFYQGAYATLAELQAANLPVAFTVGSGSSPGIPSYDVWQCANSLAMGSAAALNVQKMIAAAFNRGVMNYALDDVTCQNAAGTFYPAGGIYNSWAALFHQQVSSNGLAYGFPYDDVCNQNPSISLSATQSVTVTLGKFFS